ncbi:hypothetical protein OH491_27390 (plasmid) [Termitidicoccus mucosus]|uniref:Uncharacterized protein n=1 Tax=Termitidicoccus mucosus TaxID=1184151 RepID=A0A178IQ06_9BACT|nr:hypothetical protein AW736_26240 [Opitutaceae bacterium TSB47]
MPQFDIPEEDLVAIKSAQKLIASELGADLIPTDQLVQIVVKSVDSHALAVGVLNSMGSKSLEPPE